MSALLTSTDLLLEVAVAAAATCKAFFFLALFEALRLDIEPELLK